MTTLKELLQLADKTRRGNGVQKVHLHDVRDDNEGMSEPEVTRCP